MIVIRLFLKLVRAILGPMLLAWERISSPKPLVRHPQEQARVDQEARSLSLYQFQTCPFCIKVRREVRRLGLNLEFRDVQKDPARRAEIIAGGGSVQVPCLRIEEPQGVRWMYESDAINEYLRDRFGAAR